MIRKRNNSNIVEKKVSEENQTGDVKSPVGYSDISIKTFRDQAIEVLNILDERGINIYSPDNYGGMYLKQNKGLGISRKLKTIFSEKPSTINKQSSTNNDEKLDNLFTFFKKQQEK